MVYKSVSTNFDFTVGCWDERKWFLAEAGTRDARLMLFGF